MKSLLPVTAILVLLAGPVAAGDRPAKASSPRESLSCTYEMATGSHLKRRVCMTSSERKARRDADQQRARELQGREFKTNIKD